MPKSASLRAADWRDIVRLAGECRDLGDDPRRWREHLFRQLGRLAQAPVVVGGEQGGLLTGRLRDMGHADVGWEHGFDRAGWVHATTQGVRDPDWAVTHASYRRAAPPERWVDLPRRAVVADDIYYRSDAYQTAARMMGIDHEVYCFHPVAGTGGDEWAGVILMRAAGVPDFTARQRALVREAHSAVAALVGGPLARMHEPSPAALPPRARDVLRGLLEGDTDKQLAARLGITRNTVNQHAKRVFAHFRVTSRGELLARWVRRGWGAGGPGW